MFYSVTLEIITVYIYCCKKPSNFLSTKKKFTVSQYLVIPFVKKIKVRKPNPVVSLIFFDVLKIFNVSKQFQHKYNTHITFP